MGTEVRVFFLYRLFLKELEFKILNLPSWALWGWPAQGPDTSYAEIVVLTSYAQRCSENGAIEGADFCEAFRKQLVGRAPDFSDDPQGVYFDPLP